MRASAMLRPLLLAALLEDDRGLAGRPALLVSADDRSARDLAADLRAYLAPRRVRFYPSRGTGYASHVTPPPHLVGLRIDALDALARDRARTRSSSPAPPRSPRPSPTPRCAPPASRSPAARRSTSAPSPRDLVAAGYERVEQVEERGQFAVRGGILDVFPATEERAVRIELFGDEVESMRWFSTFTQRSLGDAERVELAPAAELDAEHRELAELAAMEAAEEGEEPPSLAEVLPLERLRGPARPRPRVRRGDPRRRRGDRAGAARPLGGRDDGDARRRRPPPLRRRRRAAGRARRPLADRAPARTTPTPSAPPAPSRPPAASRRPRASWRSWSAPATAPSSPSTTAARRSAPATTSTASTSPCSTAAASRPTPASPSPRRACARASSAPS